MDLNARPKRNLWDIFHCCHNNSALSNDEENDENNTLPTKFSATDNYAFTPIKFLNVKMMDAMSPSAVDDLNTPSTVAIADFSFETQDSKLETINEDENNLFDDDDISEVEKVETEKQKSDSEEKDFDEQDASFIYDNMTDVAEHQNDTYDVPNMNSYYLYDHGDTKARKDSEAQKRNKTAADEINFYHFFIFMMLRHFFGSLLLGGAQKTSYWEKFLLLTNHNSKMENEGKSSKESPRTMKLRKLKLGEGKCEVYPSLSDVPTIPEDEVLL